MCRVCVVDVRRELSGMAVPVFFYVLSMNNTTQEKKDVNVRKDLHTISRSALFALLAISRRMVIVLCAPSIVSMWEGTVCANLVMP